MTEQPKQLLRDAQLSVRYGRSPRNDQQVEAREMNGRKD
jgi:hypothetical protein